MAFEKFFALPENKYGQGFVVQEYNGRWFVQEARKSDGEGTLSKSWISKYKKKGEFICKDDGTPYVFPLGVEISMDAANAILKLDSVGDDIGF